MGWELWGFDWRWSEHQQCFYEPLEAIKSVLEDGKWTCFVACTFNNTPRGTRECAGRWWWVGYKKKLLPWKDSHLTRLYFFDLPPLEGVFLSGKIHTLFHLVLLLLEEFSTPGNIPINSSPWTRRVTFSKTYNPNIQKMFLQCKKPKRGR